MGFYNLNSCFKKSIWLLRGKGVNPYEFLFRILPLIAKDFEFFDFLNFFFYFQGIIWRPDSYDSESRCSLGRKWGK